VNGDVAIKLTNVSKTFQIREKSTNSIRDRAINLLSFNNKARNIKALHNINLEIKRGEFFGIIGRNGSGKSTLLKLIMGAFPPDKGGKIYTNGRMIRLALGMGFDPGLSARDNIYVNGSVLGLSFRQIGQKFDEIIDFAELDNFVDTPVKFYSSGMRSRLAFAIAIHAEADIFLMDEFFGGVGDEIFKKKSEEVFQTSILNGRTIIHVSHSLKTFDKHCERLLLLDKGEHVMLDHPETVIEYYRSNYRGKAKIGNKMKV